MDGTSSSLASLIEALKGEREPAQVALLAEEALHQVSRDENPMLWASLLGTMAASLATSVSGQFTDESFRKVLGAYEAALTVFTPEQTPGEWIDTQCNVGATHVGAVESGIGNATIHGEAAIAAFQKALELPFDQYEPSKWLACHFKLAGALELSALWRGPSALVESARVYAAALKGVSQETSPDVCAILNLKRGSSLSESGLDSAVEEAIQACEDALRTLRAQTQPLDWAAAHLLLGGLYRTRRAGSRDENLECATGSLESALSVYTRETTPEEWFRAHYHRGPAYLFREHGDRGDNLERALESLHIAIDGISRDSSREVWASLQVAFGQAYLERVGGERKENVEAAISALESALEVLSPSSGSSSWILSNRFLGVAYLERAVGDQGENIERSIAVLRAVLELWPESGDPGAWIETQTHLAEAYKRRVRQEPECNRARAIDCLEKALTLPADMWPDMDSWSLSQAALAQLYLDENAEGIGKPAAEEQPRRTRAKAGDDSRPQDVDAREKRDPFDLAGQAREQVEGLEKSFLAGEGPMAIDPGWHVPSLLNEEVSLLDFHLRKFIREGASDFRTPAERSDLERGRLNLFRMIMEHLEEKYSAARRTQTLFREVIEGKTGFVLFLRGFAFRPAYFKTVMVVTGTDLSETFERKRLVQKLSPIPLVFVSNPIDSGPLERDAGEMDESAMGFRIESGANWEDDVRTLIRSASFIVVHNPGMTPGLVAEIGLIDELGRLPHTFFKSPENARKVVGSEEGNCLALTNEAIERLRAETRGRTLQPGSLPAPTCRWVEGSRRARIDHEIKEIGRWVKRLASARTPLSTDLKLDANAYLLARLVLLESVNRLPPVLLEMSKVLVSVDESLLPEAKSLAEWYSRFADELRVRWEHAPASLPFLERVAEALRPDPPGIAGSTAHL